MAHVKYHIERVANNTDTGRSAPHNTNMKANFATRRIRNAELFRECRRSELAQIALLGVEIDVPPNCVLCADGTPGLEFFVLLDGIVEVRTRAGRVALIHPGGWFGELALLENGTRHATVTTVSRSALMVFGQREFASILEQFPTVEMKVRRRAASYTASFNHECWSCHQAVDDPFNSGLAADCRT